ncbi:hypothetical protein WJX84_008482 [Apatococcus fuscideae]
MPFVKIVGQEEMKLALLLNVVDPRIGGVLIMGDRGTGKSVAVRSLAELLPQLEVVADDPFNSSPTDASLMGQDALARARAGEDLPVAQAPTPLVELPLGATEDRICGTIDIERALQEGIKAFEPGLLARCNRGILYVDEVNLLDDGIVDLILDSAAGGVNTVEREGISVVHPAKFIMIGSGNPSEGELRPQLLDRFGLSVQVFTLPDIKQRVTLVLDRLLFEQDPDGFVADSEAEQEALRQRLRKAQEALPNIEIDREVRLRISEACSLLDVDGIRGDIVTNRTAAALAAYEGRNEVTLEDVSRIIGLCLGHRLRKDPLDQIDGGAKVKLAWQRVTNPKAAEAAAEERKQAEAEEKKAKEAKAKSQQKGGSWGGLPGRR